MGFWKIWIWELGGKRVEVAGVAQNSTVLVGCSGFIGF